MTAQRHPFALAFALAVTALVLGLPSGRAALRARGQWTVERAAESSPSPRPDQAALATQSDVEFGLSPLPGSGRVVARAAGTGRCTNLRRSCRLRTAAARRPAAIAAASGVRPRSPPGALPT